MDGQDSVVYRPLVVSAPLICCLVKPFLVSSDRFQKSEFGYVFSGIIAVHAVGMHPELHIIFLRRLAVNDECRFVTIVGHLVFTDDIFNRNDVCYCVFAEPDRAFIAVYCCIMVNFHRPAVAFQSHGCFFLKRC